MHRHRHGAVGQRHQHRHGGVGVVAGSELPKVIRTARVHLAGAGEEQTVVIPARRGRHWLDRDQRRLTSHRLIAQAQLAHVVVSEGEHAAVLHDGHGVQVRPRHGHHLAAEGRDQRWLAYSFADAPHLRGGQTKLALLAVAARQQATLAVHHMQLLRAVACTRLPQCHGRRVGERGDVQVRQGGIGAALAFRVEAASVHPVAALGHKHGQLVASRHRLHHHRVTDRDAHELS